MADVIKGLSEMPDDILVNKPEGEVESVSNDSETKEQWIVFKVISNRDVKIVKMGGNLAGLWGLYGDIQIVDLQGGIGVAKFESDEDLKRLLKGTPWKFANDLVFRTSSAPPHTMQPSSTAVTASVLHSFLEAVLAEAEAPSPRTDGLPCERMESVKHQISEIVKTSLTATFPNEQGIEALVSACTTKFGDYQCNNAMGLWSKIKGKSTEFRDPKSIGEAIMRNIPSTDIIKSTSVAPAGFVNIVLSNRWIAGSIMDMLRNGMGVWAPVLSIKRAVVDFSSPNIAKEMHVGNLRSTIIGDTLSRMLEYANVDVLCRNHVGDWGTQFGMLIQYLFEEFPNWKEDSENAIGDLQQFYKKSKLKFDEDSQFKERARQAVVQLQKGETEYRTAWEQICEISRREFSKVYQRLGVHIEEKGESFYNPYIKDLIKELSDKGLVEESEGARVIIIEGQPIPLIVVKSDGGYNYASTDLAALWYRINVEKADWLIYVTGSGQSSHFDRVFRAAEKVGWLPDRKEASLPRASHVGFGLVLCSYGKPFRTRSTEVVRLVDLLDEAVRRCSKELIQRLEGVGKLSEWTEQEIKETAEAIGYAAVKYADLKNNRLTNYTFSYDQMLNDKGNTAVYLLYAHARVCSIIRKSGKDLENLKKRGTIILDHSDERALAIHLIQFIEIVKEACMNLLPNILCDYLYNLSELFTRFYSNCQVVGHKDETSRLLLCEATAVVMRKCFHLLGIEPVYKI